MVEDGVNPSLTISAVCERAAASLVRRVADFGLPAPPKGFRHQVPGEQVGLGYIHRALVPFGRPRMDDDHPPRSTKDIGDARSPGGPAVRRP